MKLLHLTILEVNNTQSTLLNPKTYDLKNTETAELNNSKTTELNNAETT